MGNAESSGPTNVETLLAAGVIQEGLPEDYYPVFERLSDKELAVILTVKARLDATERHVSDQVAFAGFVSF